MTKISFVTMLAVGFTTAMIGLAPAQAATTKHCDWVGPGARATYVCRPQSLSPASVQAATTKHCDWVGPGARATRVCR
jgi:hypothetical protein